MKANETNEILTIAGKRVRVAYRKPGEDCCARCCFSFGGGETCVGLDGGEEWPCEKFDLATAYFVEAEQPEEETHSLQEWAQILATNPDLRAEFDKMCPPQPIQGSIAPEADVDKLADDEKIKNCLRKIVGAARHSQMDLISDEEADAILVWIDRRATHPAEADLEVEAERFFKKFPMRANTPGVPDEYLDFETYMLIARHFAEWERKRTLDKAVGWMKKNLTYVHPRKGVETCMVNIPAFLDAMNE